MNIFLACFLAVIFARIIMAVASSTATRIVMWRIRRSGWVNESQCACLPTVSPLRPAMPHEEVMQELRDQGDAKLALEIAADAYSLTPGQATCDQLVAAAAIFGKTQTAQSREARLNYAEFMQRIRQ